MYLDNTTNHKIGERIIQVLLSFNGRDNVIYDGKSAICEALDVNNFQVCKARGV